MSRPHVTSARLPIDLIRSVGVGALTAPRCPQCGAPGRDALADPPYFISACCCAGKGRFAGESRRRVTAGGR